LGVQENHLLMSLLSAEFLLHPGSEFDNAAAVLDIKYFSNALFPFECINHI
jgi:hypothetical protein